MSKHYYNNIEVHKVKSNELGSIYKGIDTQGNEFLIMSNKHKCLFKINISLNYSQYGNFDVDGINTDFEDLNDKNIELTHQIRKEL